MSTYTVQVFRDSDQWVIKVPDLVVACPDVTALPDGVTVMVDGGSGVVRADPTAGELATARDRGVRSATGAAATGSAAAAGLGQGRTADGDPVELLADLDDAQWFVAACRDVGLVGPVGVMVEVPAAALRAAELAAEVGFLSVGTNDLAQYAFARTVRGAPSPGSRIRGSRPCSIWSPASPRRPGPPGFPAACVARRRPTPRSHACSSGSASPACPWVPARSRRSAPRWRPPPGWSAERRPPPLGPRNHPPRPEPQPAPHCPVGEYPRTSTRCSPTGPGVA